MKDKRSRKTAEDLYEAFFVIREKKGYVPLSESYTARSFLCCEASETAGICDQ